MDALWVLSYAMLDDRLPRHFQAWIAERVLHRYEAVHPGNSCIRDQIAMLRNDDATEEERAEARHDALMAPLMAPKSGGTNWNIIRVDVEAARAATERRVCHAMQAAVMVTRKSLTRAAQRIQLHKMLTQERREP
jgi:hypothetical protein